MLYCIDGVAEARCSDASDARSGTVAVCHDGSRASINVGSHRIRARGTVDRLASSTYAGLCYVRRNTSILVVHLLNV